jgi:hypothetical protein
MQDCTAFHIAYLSLQVIYTLKGEHEFVSAEILLTLFLHPFTFVIPHIYTCGEWLWWSGG